MSANLAVPCGFERPSHVRRSRLDWLAEAGGFEPPHQRNRASLPVGHHAGDSATGSGCEGLFARDGHADLRDPVGAKVEWNTCRGVTYMQSGPCVEIYAPFN